MRFKAILAEQARKRYPLSILLMVVGVLVIPFSYLFVRFGLELTSTWSTILSLGFGVIVGCTIIGLGSLVEDVHDIAMHTVGYDVEFSEDEYAPDDGDVPEEGAPEGEAEAVPQEGDAENTGAPEA